MECADARSKARRADPESAAREKAQQEAYRRARKADPERYAKVKDRAREYTNSRRRDDAEFRARHVKHCIESVKRRRASGPEFNEAHRLYLAKYRERKTKLDPKFKEKLRDATRARRSDPEYAARERSAALQKDRARNADPEFVARKRAYMRKRHQDPAVKQRHRLTANRRRARLRDVCSPGVTIAQWAAICSRFTLGGEIVCAYCRKACAVTIDHVVPIARGGKDEPSNVVPCCRFCNTSKGARLLSEWHRAPKDFAERTACLAQNNSTPERAMTG